MLVIRSTFIACITGSVTRVLLHTSSGHIRHVLAEKFVETSAYKERRARRPGQGTQPRCHCGILTESPRKRRLPQPKTRSRRTLIIVPFIRILGCPARHSSRATAFFGRRHPRLLYSNVTFYGCLFFIAERCFAVLFSPSNKIQPPLFFIERGESLRVVLFCFPQGRLRASDTAPVEG